MAKVTEKKGQLTFKLASFEGPLDLLLHLIKQNEMDIYDISMVTITSQYLEYLHQMQTLQLDIAGEYLVMAATLLNIKSKMLLPNNQPVEVTEDYEDPREDLVQQLVLHQTFQLAADQLKEYATERQKNVGREQEQVPADAKLGQLKKGATSIETLQQAFARLLAKKQLVKPVKRQIYEEKYRLKDEIVRLKTIILKAQKPLYFDSLFEGQADLERVVTTFLALLELIKQGQVLAKQEVALGPILMIGGEETTVIKNI